MRSKSVAKLLVDAAELRAGSVVTESEVQALKRRWSPRVVRSFPDINPHDECARLFYDHEDRPITYRISDEQAQKGIDWLRKMIFTPKGVLRKNAFVRDHISDIDLVVEAIKDFSHFELVHFDCLSTGHGWEYWFPIYSCIANSGKRFNYRAGSWQSGGFEIYC